MKFKLLAWTLGASLAWPLCAQTQPPSTEQMIEQLKAPRAPRLRNLVIEVAPAPTHTETEPGQQPTPTVDHPEVTGAVADAPTARPSLSLMIQFDFNSARMRPESRQALANLSLALQSPGLVDSRFAVEGHTDAKGNAAINLKLSEKRAQAVRDFLKSKGIAADRLVAVGKGSAEPANSADPFAAENRRVRIINLD